MKQVIVDVKNYLGNQMFQYAIVKSFALEHDIEFCFISNVKHYADSDTNRGSNIDSIFILKDKQCYNYPEKINAIYYDEWICKYQEEELHVVYGDQRITPELLKNIRNGEVFNWFEFDSTLEKEVRHWINSIKKNDDQILVSCHFRANSEYLKNGFLMNYDYWKRAADYCINNINKDVIFIVFSDDYNSKIVKRFVKEYRCIVSNHSLAFDLCAIKNCDVHIICNSTFSIWGALLDKKRGTTVCPDKFYSFGKKDTHCLFLDEWIHINCSLNPISKITYVLTSLPLRLIRVLQNSDVLKNIWHALPNSFRDKFLCALSKIYEDYS